MTDLPGKLSHTIRVPNLPPKQNYDDDDDYYFYFYYKYE